MRDEDDFLRCDAICGSQAVPAKPEHTQHSARLVLKVQCLSLSLSSQAQHNLTAAVSRCFPQSTHDMTHGILHAWLAQQLCPCTTRPDTVPDAERHYQVMTIMPRETWDIALSMPLSSLFGAALGLWTTVYTLTTGSNHLARSASCHMMGIKPNSCACTQQASQDLSSGEATNGTCLEDFNRPPDEMPS